MFCFGTSFHVFLFTSNQFMRDLHVESKNRTPRKYVEQHREEFFNFITARNRD